MKFLTLLLAASLLALPACKQKQPDTAITDPTIHDPATHTPADWTYTVRARVEKLPDGFTDLVLHHEHIPDFVAPQTGKLHVNKDGVTGMKAMIMGFEPAKGVDIADLKVGDLIELELAVWGKDSSRGMASEMSSFTRLPPETELDFANKPSIEIPTTDGP